MKFLALKTNRLDTAVQRIGSQQGSLPVQAYLSAAIVGSIRFLASDRIHKSGDHRDWTPPRILRDGANIKKKDWAIFFLRRCLRGAWIRLQEQSCERHA